VDRGSKRRFVGFWGRRSAVLFACLGTALTVGVVGRSAASVPSFGSPKQYATGFFPLSVAIGDLNGDAKPEVVTANREDQTVSVLLNKGDGTFRAKRDFATGTRPVQAAIGDLNNDRKPDLVTANRNALNISVLLNRAMPPSSPSTTMQPDTGPGRSRSAT
jgi:hypothetical protein